MKNSFSHTNLVQKYFHNPSVPEGAVRISLNAPNSAPQTAEAAFARMAQGNTINHGTYKPNEIGQLLDQARVEQEVQLRQTQQTIANIKANPNSTAQDLKVAQQMQDSINFHDQALQMNQMATHSKLANNPEKLPMPPTVTPVFTPKNATKANVDAVMDNYEKTADNAIIARLFGLNDNFFNSSGFGSIKSKNSLSSMLIAVKHAVESGKIPTDRRGWEAIGYNVNGFIMQKSELNRLVSFAKHVQSNPQVHLKTIDYITSFTSNNREGYIRATEDIHGNRLTKMADDGVKKMDQDADGRLVKRSDTIISALVGSDDKNYSNVDIRDLQAALTRAVNQGYPIEDIYQRITGQQLNRNGGHDLAVARLNFRDALEVHLSLMKASGWANAGLDALLQNKSGEYLNATRQYLSNGGLIELKTRDGKKFNNKQLNIASGIATAIGAVVTGGILSMNIRQGSDVTTDNIINQLQSNPSVQNKFGNVLGAIGNFFLGRNFKLSIGQDDFLKAFENRILDRASDVLKITYNTNPATITNPGLRNAFEIAKNNGYIKSESDMQIFHKAIIEHIIDSEARGVSDQKAIWASLNPVFFGIHYDRVNSRKVATEMSQANLIEGEITKDKMDPSRIQGVNISPDNKVFTINSKLPDYTWSSNGQFEVVTMGTNGEFLPITSNTFNHETPKNMHLTLVMSQGKWVYVLKFTDRPLNDTKPTEVQLSEDNTPAMTAKVTRMFEARSSFIKNTRDNMGDSIYMMTRDKKYTNFNDAMGKIGDQKYEEALALLSKGRTNTEKKLYQAFKDNPEGLATALTFKYGTINKNRQGPASANQYAKDHPQVVINAENRLTTHNKTTAEVESMFKKHSVHTPTELSSLLDGQNLAVSVYATPKGGKHRIDKFSGSITVSNLVLPIKSADAKAEIFDRHKVDNQKNLDSINAYLRSNITMDQFKDWMVNGNLPEGINPNMTTKQPQFMEARAMIQGNLCANKTEVMAYPLLKVQPKPPVLNVDNNASIFIGESTALADTKVEGIHSDIGINPWMIPNKKTTTTEPHNTSTTPKPEPLPNTVNNTNIAGNWQVAGEVGAITNNWSNFGGIALGNVNPTGVSPNAVKSASSFF